MRKRISMLDGGQKELLFDKVKDARQRAAVVFVHEEVTRNDVPTSIVTPCVKPANLEWEVSSLNAVLVEVVQMRKGLEDGMAVILRRESLVQLARERAVLADMCGWDQRLCFDNDEWAKSGADVLDSYRQSPGAASDVKAWWCPASRKCERHAGYVKNFAMFFYVCDFHYIQLARDPRRRSCPGAEE